MWLAVLVYYVFWILFINVVYPIIPFSALFWMPFVQRRLYHAKSLAGPIAAVLLVPIPGLFLAFCYLFWTNLIFGDDPISWGMCLEALAKGAVWPVLFVAWLLSAFDLAFWGVLEWRRRRRAASPSSRGKAPRPCLVFGLPALAAVSLYCAAYVSNYRTLQEAIWKGDLDLAERRIRFNLEGATLDKGRRPTGMFRWDPEARCQLASAVALRNKDMALLLMKHGASKDLNSRDSTEWNNECVDKDYKLLLETPIERRDPEMLEFMLDHGSNVNARTPKGITPLHAAAAHDTPRIIRTLTQRGADINAQTNDGQTPLDVAFAAGNKRALDALMEHADSMTGFWAAITCGRADKCAQMIVAGQDVNEERRIESCYGFETAERPLHRAVWSTPEVLDLLLTAGADPAALAPGYGNRPETAMHLAARLNRVDQMRVFVQHDVSLELRDENLRTPLCCAVEVGAVEMVKFLCEECPQHCAYGEEESLLRALRDNAKHSHEIVRILLSRRSPMANGKNEADALRLAVLRLDLECTRMLLERGARQSSYGLPLIVELAGRTDYNSAYWSKEQPKLLELARELVEHGAAPEDIGIAARVAALRNNAELARYLRSSTTQLPPPLPDLGRSPKPSF